MSFLASANVCEKYLESESGKSTGICEKQRTFTATCPTQQAANEVKRDCNLVGEYIKGNQTFVDTRACMLNKKYGCQQYSTLGCAIEYYTTK